MDTHRRESLTRKHLAERRRRAKINYYLDEIEALISPPGAQVNAVKMEKAELLEKTVAYLKHIQSKASDATHQFQYQHAALLSSQAKALSQLGFTSLVTRPQPVAHIQQTNPLNLKTFSTFCEGHFQQAESTCQTEVNSDAERSRSSAILEPDTCEASVSHSPDFPDMSKDAYSVHQDDNSGEDFNSVNTGCVVVKKEMQTEDFMQTSQFEKQNDLGVWRPWTNHL